MALLGANAASSAISSRLLATGCRRVQAPRGSCLVPFLAQRTLTAVVKGANRTLRYPVVQARQQRRGCATILKRTKLSFAMATKL